MENIFEYILRPLSGTINKEYILPLTILILVVSGVAKVFSERKNERVRELGGIVYSLIMLSMVPFIFIWNFITFMYFLGWALIGARLLPWLYLFIEGWVYYNNPLALYKKSDRYPLGPSVRIRNKKEIFIEGAVLSLDLPADSDLVGHEFRQFKEATTEYKADDDLKPKERRLFYNKWFYNGKAPGIAKLSLDITAQDLPAFSSLFKYKNLNAAAVRYIFSHFFIPNKISNDEFTGTEIKEYYKISRWLSKPVNGHNVISYRLDREDGNDDVYYFIHYAISCDKMLSLKFKWKCYIDEKKDKLHYDSLMAMCEGMANDITQKLRLVLLNANLEQAAQYVTAGIHENTFEAPHITPFVMSLINITELHKILRDNAEDKLEWFVFESSGFFYYDWVDNQYQQIKKRFRQLRKNYIEKNMLSHMNAVLETENCRHLPE